MSNICKTVSLRTRKIKDGRMLSYYLDYYPGYRDESTMKVIRHESLGIYIYAKPKNQTEQKYNLNLTARAEAIRCRRFEAIVNERYDFFDKEKMKGDFLAYFKRLADKKNSKWQHVYMHFRTFTQGKCTFGEINVDLCNRFREYLLTAPQGLHKNRKLHINSAANYWKKILYPLALQILFYFLNAPANNGRRKTATPIREKRTTPTPITARAATV